MHHQITPGAVVQTADQIELRVRALEGNVAELEAFDGSFFGFRHVSSLTVCLPPAAETVSAPGLAAAAGTGQGAGTTESMPVPRVESVFSPHAGSALDIRSDFWDVAPDYGCMDAPSYLPAGSHRTYVCGAGYRWSYSCLDGFGARRESYA